MCIVYAVDYTRWVNPCTNWFVSCNDRTHVKYVQNILYFCAVVSKIKRADDSLYIQDTQTYRDVYNL